MTDTEPSAARKPPMFSIIAGAILALGLFTPRFLVTFPVMGAVALSIVGAIRKEKPTLIPYMVIGLAVLLLAISGVHIPSSIATTHDSLPSQTYANATWEYSTSKDDMRGTTSTLASLDSPTDLTLKAPYDGFNHAHIIVDNAQSIILMVDKGQFLCHSYGDHTETISVKFDSGPVYRYVCAMPDNGEANTLYIQYKEYDAPKDQPEPRDGIEKAKKMTVEAEMYDNGFQQFVFNVGGLDVSKLK